MFTSQSGEEIFGIFEKLESAHSAMFDVTGIINEIEIGL